MKLQKINMYFSHKINKEQNKKMNNKILSINNVNKISNKKSMYQMLNRIREFRNSCGGCGKKAVVIR